MKSKSDLFINTTRYFRYYFYQYSEKRELQRSEPRSLRERFLNRDEENQNQESNHCKYLSIAINRRSVQGVKFLYDQCKLKIGVSEL